MEWYQQRISQERREHGIEIYRVSEISSIISSVLDDGRLQDIWIRGEVTNFKPHASGHRYFSLGERKDAGTSALIQCVMWRSDAERLGFPLKDGIDVIAFGSIGHYAPQGRYQFYARDLRHAGEGEKHLLVEKWKAELAAEGIFDAGRKKELPRFPARIGVVTSETGAVLQDIRNVIARRFPLEIVVSPTAVQGDHAHLEIARALEKIDGHVDVIIIGRGGGSFEDLFPFSHPLVVRAIACCTTPVVSAIGHETDFTLADFAADVRAPTPSAAAELVVQDRAALMEGLGLFRKRLGSSLVSRLDQAVREISDLRSRIAPGRMERWIADRRQDCAMMAERLARTALTRIEREQLILSGLSARLSGRNPLALLERGYCILEKEGKTVRSVHGLSGGDILGIRMRDGRLEVQVRGVTHDKNL
ncbi:MAG TPA: exodeoxyribonuclease VII large subunit [Methanoregulaceae archaeon]|nr:MAG: exodeoxyribonuclease VII large subunit [Methanolinea sp.]HON81916.1 exodeoxyribonuclease VII large subunit [Methanoregulaceae archaeon]HPD10686.1 exodeoxyribonuclease VII large subunit [Methanoregulaceae archaeon]HRT15815.1 exodeoxyribonuclease VII large subunit [Methanoregulaceae archaeon]HRU31329.1 exodeoxyribonuclease VII large subunit [Methanoregulaceae archaeon]